MAMYDKYKLASSRSCHIDAMNEKRIDLQLEKALPCYKTYLAGRVFRDCTTVAGATVEVMDLNYNPLHHTKANESGTYIFKDIIPPGDYLVMASSDSCATSITKPITIENNHVCKANFYLEENPINKKAIVYGTLTDSFDHNVLANTRVKLIERYSKKVYACTYTNELGEYLLYDIKPGCYILYVQHENYLSYCSQVKLDKRQQYKLDILLIRDPNNVYGTINGIIKHNNYSVDHIPVFLCDETQENSYNIIQVQFTNDKGAYLFTGIPPGQYVIKCKGQDEKAITLY